MTEITKVEIPIDGGFYEMPCKQMDARTCVNWYATSDQDGKYKTALLPRGGLKLFSQDNNNGEVRGGIVLNNEAYIVVDNIFYRVTPNGSRFQLGILNTSTGTVVLDVNRTQIGIFDGSFGYVYQVLETDYRSAGEFFQIINASSTINDPVFGGTGLNDMNVSGVYTGALSAIYKIQIDGTGTPNTFKWSDTNGSTWNAQLVPITGARQKLSNGVYVNFINTTSHTLNDFWTIDVVIGSVFFPPTMPAVLNGRALYPKPNTSRFYWTAIDDFSQIDPLDYAEATIVQDNISAAATMQQELYIVGDISVELWNSVNGETPFLPRSNFLINYGIIAPQTLCVASFNIMVMLAKNIDGARVVIKIANYSAKIISNEALNLRLKTYSKVDDAFAYIIEKGAHPFYVLTIPDANETWTCDLSTNKWYRWVSYEENLLPRQQQFRWGEFRGSCHFILDDKHIIGDSKSGKLFQLDDSTYQDYDLPMVFEWTSQHIYSKDDWITLYSIVVDVQRAPNYLNSSTQIGTPTSPPKIMLQLSRDGGMTWGAEMWRELGDTGEYSLRAFWDDLGLSRVFTIRIKITDPAYSVILGVWADMEGNN